ncbi:MAG: hypothetical protein WCG05_03535 [Alphaproteobacteria bacterium]
MKICFLLCVVLLAACGKKGGLRAPEDSTYPRTYPTQTVIKYDNTVKIPGACKSCTVSEK